MRQISTLILCLAGIIVLAQEDANLFYSSGKIYVVVAVLLIIFSGIVAYCLKDKKPRIKLSPSEFELMAV